MKTSLSLAAVFGLFSLSACNSSGTAGDPYYAAWYNAFGEPCSYSYNQPRPGCNYFQNGMKIRVMQDPFYFQWPQDGRTWFSPSGIWYDTAGFAINADPVNEEQSADVITQAAEQENQIVRLAAKNISEEYALNEASSLRITRSLQDWATLGRDRARTESDVADFSERLYGIKVVKIQAALNQAATSHSLKPLEDLNVDVAAHWNTSPEVSKAILKKWYQGQLSL